MATKEGSELIVLARLGDDMFSEAVAPPGAGARGVNDLVAVLQRHEARMGPLFLSDDAGPADAMESVRKGRGADELPPYFRVDAPADRLEALAKDLQALESIEAAFIKPPAEPAMAPPAGATPDFTPRQGYLLAPPGGVNAVWAASRPGGDGTGITVIDVEGAWRTTHEDLRRNSLGLLRGVHSTLASWRHHGTAVWGEIGGDRNGLGVTGIAHGAKLGAVSIFGPSPWGSARAIAEAARRLNPGDVLLVELHRPGPRATGVGQQGYIAVEWWPDDFAAVRFAARRGILVVEAAGNGGEDLDHSAYNAPAPGFPPTWRNPFRRGAADSGAILVGAGAPPSGNHGPDRSRLDFSNFGACIDAQGWGREVVTCGYGHLQAGPNEDTWYTDQFSGTSSASPIVVGALAATQGILAAGGRPRMTPAIARGCLRATGSPQQNAPARPTTQRIGNRPDIQALVACASTATPPL